MAFITVEGEQLKAQKQGANEALVIDRFILANISGLGAEPVDRIATIPSAGNIVYDVAPTQAGYVNPNQVVYSLHLDTNVGDFSFNWIGIAAGNVLIAVAYLPAAQTKSATAGGVTGNNITRNILLAFSGAQALTGITVEASTWQIDFTARLWDSDERRRRQMADLYGRQLFFGQGWQLIKTGTAYNLQSGVGMVAGLRIERTSLLAVGVGLFPSAVWLDVSQQGDLSGLSETVNVVVSTAAQLDYIDTNQRPHYLVKIADISAAGVVTDTRTVHQVDSDVISYLTRAATTDYRGIAEKATVQEGVTGTDNERFITSVVAKAIIDAVLPAGIVVMWTGATNQVPSGWGLCDGGSGRPDMRDRFVVGVGPTYTQGVTGGTDSKNTGAGGAHAHTTGAAGAHAHGITVDGHTLTVAEMPAHTHTLTATAATPANYGAGYSASTGAQQSGPVSGTNSTGSNQAHSHTASSGGVGDHAHTVSVAADHTHSIDVRPRYYAIAFIIKI